ncbi:glycoside hydrolase family 31 protein [Hydrogenoanaerobacterium saccharovorans]|uniref:glycoside hydrolase family 31 protein n=1 Tax=Hydrogenoanaerobacterium saccharovorans TaxID=474960 RepID=UPI000B8158C0
MTAVELRFLEKEYWYGGYVTEGVRQPYGAESDVVLDLTQNSTPNQAMPLFVSTHGRWLWQDRGFPVQFKKGVIDCPDDVEIGKAGDSLRTAYSGAMKKHFPFHPCHLAPQMFQTPVYNTWIELTFYQTQQAVLNYAENIVRNGLPAGVLIIDDGWSDYYGKWSFSRESFSAPEQMLRQLHEWGFFVMVWVCPFITPDTLVYRELKEQNLLVKNGCGEVHIAHWWNGWSAVLDLSKAAARSWLDKQMDELRKLGVDGFKFDAGDSTYYPVDGEISPDGHSGFWAAYGERFHFNEFRVTTKAGGWSLMQRLCDKDHSWGETGLAALIPDALIQNLTGHPFCSPDMIGGGEYRNFLSQTSLDPELFLRHTEVACLMPVMQFSAAPWRVLSSPYFDRIKNLVQIRNKYWEEINRAIQLCRETGEPILRPLEYEFPNQGWAQVMDEFMLGDALLVAPILVKNTNVRQVAIPKGCWGWKDAIIESTGMILEITTEQGDLIVLRKL